MDKFPVRLFSGLGGVVIAVASKILREIGEIALLQWEILKAIFRVGSRWRTLRRFYLQPIIEQMTMTGVRSIPVVLTTALFTGMVLAVQTGVTLENKIQGTSMFIGNIVNLSLVRELGPVLTAILVTGRVGSAMAAEIGTMKITEQIDALRTLAANPIEHLAMPRFVAVFCMLPLLTILADVTGAMGGWLVAAFHLGISSNVYWGGAIDTVQFSDVLSGLSKTFFFAAILVVFALHRGFKTYGGAEGVGKATTGSVVNASITILITDYFLTQLYAIF